MTTDATDFPDPSEPAGDPHASDVWASKPSEFALGLAALVPALPETAARDLMRLLGHSLAAPSPSELREARLGLLLDLVADGTGEFVGVERYETERSRRGATGEIWPAHSTLVTAFGDWTRAVKAAMRLTFEGTGGMVPHSTHHVRAHTPAYKRDEVLAALRRCCDHLGDWPSEWEYAEWTRVSRRLARNAGKTGERLPSTRAVRRLFGDYGRALRVAMTEQEAS